LGRNAQVNPPSNYEGPSALAAACGNDDLDMVRLLLDHGISPNPHSPHAPPPLSEAAKTGNLEIALLLLAAGAQVSIHTAAWIRCPLVAAAAGKQLDMVSFLMTLENRPEVFEKARAAARNKGFAEITACIEQHMEQKGLGSPQANARAADCVQSEEQEFLAWYRESRRE
jgi:hypothetical protein